MEPESEEVTKNTTTITMASIDSTPEKGKFSRKANSASATSADTASPSAAWPWLRISSMAELPNTVIHISVKPVGTKSTPMANSRMVRPRDTRAMNSPTKGAQDIHQPQYRIVQPPIQSVFW